MGLKTKIVLTMAFLVVFPMTLSVLMTLRTVEAAFQREFRDRLDKVASGARDQVQQKAKDYADAMKRLSESEDVVDRILLDMRKGTFDGPAQAELSARLPGLMNLMGMDLFKILDAQGQVIAAGHLPALAGYRDKDAPTMAKKHPLQPAIRMERMQSGDTVSEVLTRQVAMPVRRYDSELILVAGHVLGQEFLRQLSLASGAEVWLQDQKGQSLASTTNASPQGPLVTVPLLDPDGSSPAVLVFAVSDQNLKATIRILTRTSTLAAGSGILLSVIIGAFLSRRITRPLEELVAGAWAVASGRLNQTIRTSARDEVGALVQAFNTMTGRLQESQRNLIRAERVAAWREIARRLAHEIKNPLFPIQMSIETLRKVYRSKHPDLDEIFLECTETILEEVEALKRIVTEFSRFARLPPPQLAPLDINDVVESALALHAGVSETIGVDKELAEGLPPVMADRDQVGQVLLNLIANAVEAMPEGGTLRLVTGRDKGGVMVQVRDTGMGVPEDAQDRIFTPYFTTKTQGTGLGLAIALRIVEDHGGTLSVTSQPGQGSTFTLTLHSGPSQTND